MIAPPAADKSDVLLATKTGIPRIRSDLLPRLHLARRLEQAAGGELILVSTPAGFGKTTLLASWARSSARRVAWLSLDRDDNDPTRFWRYVVTAIGQVHSGIGSQALSLLDAAAQPTLKAVVTALVNELAAQPDELVLVLDDYHVIESSAVHDSLTFLLEHLSPRMLVVISSRSDPPFPLARLRARGQLVELRLADLRFTLQEAASLLGRVWELDLPEAGIAALEERTEGWVTGLQLAALSLRGAPNPVQFIEGFTGSQRYVLDYLTEEVIQGQPENVQAFLLQTSILESLNSELCEAVLGVDRSSCQQILEYLEQANLFLVPLDEQRRWYRYHHLFADLLLALLQFAHPQQAAELHRKAAAWFEGHEMASEALRHILAAGETLWAARLVERHVEEILRRGEGERLRGWLAALPKEVVRARPRLALAQAIAAFNAGRLREAELLLDDAELAFATFPNDPYEPSVGKEMSMLANVPASIALLRASLAMLRGEAGRTTELVHKAQSHLKQDERGPLISVHWNLALADWMGGRLADAERAFAGIMAQGVEAGEAHLMLTAGAALGHIRSAQGRLEAALHTYQAGLEFVSHAGNGLVLSAAVAHVGIAEVCYQRNQLEQARHHAQEGISLGRQLTSTQALADGLATLAWIRQAMGDPTGARQAMDEAYQVAPSPEIVALQNRVPAERARLSLAQGDLREAARWVEERRLAGTDELNYPRERDYLVLARVFLGQRLPERAFGLLERIGALAEAQNRSESFIEVLILEATALDALGNPARAITTLARALALAEPEGYNRIFADEGAPVAGLLRQARSRGVAPDYTNRLLAAFGEQALSSSLRVPGLPQSLSERELEILRLVAAGLTTQEMAGELSIATGTLRTHLKNIYRKLDAHSRIQAVERARTLNLL